MDGLSFLLRSFSTFHVHLVWCHLVASQGLKEKKKEKEDNILVDVEKWFGTFPRNLVIKSLRYLMSSVGCAICKIANTRPWEACNLFRISMWDSGHQLWDCHESKGARSPPSPLARVLGRGFEVVFGRNRGLTVRQSNLRLTSVKSEDRVELTGEGTSERFDFRASRAVCPPQDERHVAKVMMACGALMRRLAFRGMPFRALTL
ncbi:unnamed protein product [Prunus armeniaca]